MANITFSVTLTIILIILPGGIFRRAYLSSEFSNYHLRASNFSEIVFTIGVGFIFQTLGILVVQYIIPGYQIDFELIGGLLTSPNSQVFYRIGKFAFEIFIYHVILYFLCFFIGRRLLYFILTRRLDETQLMLKFDNEWNYIFSGKAFARKKEDEIYKYANVCVSNDDCFVVYTGFLTNYWLGKDGQLEIIELKKVKRKIIQKTWEDSNVSIDFLPKLHKPTHTEYVFVVDKLLIPYTQIKNLSITYYDLEEIRPTSSTTK